MSTDEKRMPDPFRAWREWFQENEQRWSDTMTEVMGDDRFAKGMGRYFQEALHTHRMFTDSMAQYLGNLNLPARSDILALGDRIGQLEDAIAAHPAVRSVAVIGYPDERLGERICAVIVADEAAPDANALVDFVKGRGLPKHLWPEHVRRIDAMPATPAGKIRKNDLRAWLADQIAAEGTAA